MIDQQVETLEIHTHTPLFIGLSFLHQLGGLHLNCTVASRPIADHLRKLFRLSHLVYLNFKLFRGLDPPQLVHNENGDAL